MWKCTGYGAFGVPATSNSAVSRYDSPTIGVYLVSLPPAYLLV